jgi:hypothetical protein
MSQTANTIDTLNGMFKEVYADKIENLIPDGVKLYNMIPFNKESKALGNLYHQPVVLGLEHGITYGGPNGDAFALNSSIAGQMKDAQVQGFEMILRSVLSVGAASRSLNSNASFEKATKHLVANMLRSIARRMEVQLLYGKRGNGTVDGNVSGDEIIDITDATWAPGIWSGAETMLVDIYQSDLTSLRVANLEIASVSFDDRSITLTVGADGVVLDGDVIFYKGANGNEFDGVDSIIRNTGTLFNISASSFNLWQGNVSANGGTPRALSFAVITRAITRLVEKGLGDQEVMVLINPLQFDVLLAEQDAKRMYDSSYSDSKATAGHKEIMFYSQNGAIKIVSSIYVKAGSAYVLCMDEFMRVGSSDITFKQPGFEGEFFRLLNDSNGYELRAYTDQALFCTAPGRNSVIDDLSVPVA